ncbi:flap endonuclease-1 [Pancytospora philotis]|nr:flap endonuclease-1 [Pancytospora philotis]
MGVKQLSKLIKEKTRSAVVPRKFSYYHGAKVAIDASMAIYQFLVAVRSDGSALSSGDSTTSHLSGLFYRTIKFVESGIIPVYVFDGVAPASKVGELKKRQERRDKALVKLEEARQDGDLVSVAKFEKRQVKIEAFHIEECKKLLTLMGIPHATAVSEAEAYCAFLCKAGCVKAVATEDMDALCFGAPLLLRNMNASQAKKLDIDEYNLKAVLGEMGLSMDAFIDLCILLGCDFCDTIKGIGPKRALEHIKQHGSIEKMLENEKLELPANYSYELARGIFKDLSSIGDEHTFRIDYENIDRDAIMKYLCEEKGFDTTRISNGIEKLTKTYKKGSQLKLDSFFVRN